MHINYLTWFQASKSSFIKQTTFNYKIGQLTQSDNRHNNLISLVGTKQWINRIIWAALHSHMPCLTPQALEKMTIVLKI